jgi:hypothetical protein
MAAVLENDTHFDLAALLNIRLCARIRKAGEMAATLRMALDLEVA